MRRMAEQDAVLGEAVRFVKPGGRAVYVTCSFFVEENEDRISRFLAANQDFVSVRAIDQITASGLLKDDGRAAIAQCETPSGFLRLTPARLGTDGFFVAVLERKR